MTAVEDHRAARAAVGTCTLDVVARVVLPVAEDPDVLPLYVDGAHTPEAHVDDDVPTLTLPSDQHPDQVVSRRSYRIDAGGRTSFATYLNAFPASYWRRFTSVREVTLRVLTTGPGTLVVYRSSARGAVARVTSRRLDGIGTHHLALPLTSFVDGGWYWFDLVAGTEPLVLDTAEWCVPSADDPTEPRPRPRHRGSRSASPPSTARRRARHCSPSSAGPPSWTTSWTRCWSSTRAAAL